MRTKKYTRKHLYLVVSIIIFILAAVVFIYPYFGMKAGKDGMLYIYPETSDSALRDSLSAKFGTLYASKVMSILAFNDTDLATRTGAYKVNKGDNPVKTAKSIISHIQTPVKFTFNNIRTKEQFAEKVATKFMMTKDDLLKILKSDQICKSFGCDTNTIVSIFLPDSYEFYWDTDPLKFLNVMYGYYKKWWTEEREAKAEALGLSKSQVAVLASIVEEETIKKDEQGTVARLYLNRLDKNMKLQADPTIKFALKDFSLRRIGGKHLNTVSPYNTYINYGLPPGPIRIPDKAAIDAVLNAPVHNYIYMCAKEDFSGYHNFTSSYSEHLSNAAKYRTELDKRNIR